MIDFSSGLLLVSDAPSLVPDDGPIDLHHLARMTLGEEALEREVLALFDRQAVLLMRKMWDAPAGAVAAAAHTLKGSAAGIGAWGVVRAAEAVELCARQEQMEGQTDLRDALHNLDISLGEARAVIGQRLGV